MCFGIDGNKPCRYPRLPVLEQELLQKYDTTGQAKARRVSVIAKEAISRPDFNHGKCRRIGEKVRTKKPGVRDKKKIKIFLRIPTKDLASFQNDLLFY